jgi:hypothetical protein
MAVITVEGTVEHGELKLTVPIPLPDHTKVSVVISDVSPVSRVRIVSPRLAHPEQVTEFQMEVSEESSDDPV